MRYGALPIDLGPIYISPVEMMFWMYCPIATPRESVIYPVENLWQFSPIIDAVRAHVPQKFATSYVYLTAKTLFVSGECGGTRPGWHSDGFGTHDVNFIWYDSAPTEFIEADFTLPPDCADAMEKITAWANARPTITYPCRHLLALTPSVIHRPPTTFEPGVRSFVKVSLSADRYNLEGNSINYRLDEHWPNVPRQVERNHPTAKPLETKP